MLFSKLPILHWVSNQNWFAFLISFPINIFHLNLPGSNQYNGKATWGSSVKQFVFSHAILPFSGHYAVMKSECSSPLSQNPSILSYFDPVYIPTTQSVYLGKHLILFSTLRFYFQIILINNVFLIKICLHFLFLADLRVLPVSDLPLFFTVQDSWAADTFPAGRHRNVFWANWFLSTLSHFVSKVIFNMPL